MGNVSGEQKGNMKETMHTDTRLTNDDEIIYTFNDASRVASASTNYLVSYYSNILG